MWIIDFYNEGAFSRYYVFIDVSLLLYPLIMYVAKSGYKAGIGKYKQLPIGHNEYHLPIYIRNSSSETWDECLKLYQGLLSKACLITFVISFFLLISGYILVQFKMIIVIVKSVVFLLKFLLLFIYQKK